MQQSETILVEGQPCPMLAAPLEEYWSVDHPKPKDLFALSTGCYRGYLGTWEICNDYLLLLKIERVEYVKNPAGETEEQRILVSKKVVMSAASEDPFVADWFSGVIPVARGVERGYIGYDHECPEVDYLYIDKGRVVRRIPVHNIVDSLPNKRVVNRESAWDGEAGIAADVSKAADDWVTLDYIYSHYEQLVDRDRPLRLRGVYFPGKIWFPPPKTPREPFRIVTKGNDDLPEAGSNIEITAVLKAVEGPHYFVVTRIKVLPASEPIRRLPPQRN